MYRTKPPALGFPRLPCLRALAAAALITFNFTPVFADPDVIEPSRYSITSRSKATLRLPSSRVGIEPKPLPALPQTPPAKRNPGPWLPPNGKTADSLVTNLTCEVTTVPMKTGNTVDQVAFFDGKALEVTVKNEGKGIALAGVKVEIRRADAPQGPRVAWFAAGATTAPLAPGGVAVVKVPYIPVLAVSGAKNLAARKDNLMVPGGASSGGDGYSPPVVAVVDADQLVAEGPAGEADNLSKPFRTGIVSIVTPKLLPTDDAPDFDGNFTLLDVKYKYDQGSKKIVEVRLHVKADCNKDFFLGDYGDPAFGCAYARCIVYTVEKPVDRNPYKIVGDNMFSVAKTIYGGAPGYLKPMTYPQGWIPAKASFWLILQPDCKQAVEGAWVNNQKLGRQVGIAPKLWVKLMIFTPSPTSKFTPKTISTVQKEVTISEAPLK